VIDGKLGVAIQGAGWVSSEHIRAYVRNPHAEVVAIGSRTLDGARAKRDQFGLNCEVYDDYDRLLADPRVDVVSICTPPERHPIEAIRGAEVGKHLLIEKPVATNEEDLYAMRDAVRKAKVKTLVGFVLRWNPMFNTIKSLIANGALGQVFMAEVDYWHGRTINYASLANRARRVPTMSTFLGGGCHAVDAARYFMESDVVEVSAYNAQVDQGVAVPLNTIAIVRFANGAMGKISASSELRSPYIFNVELLGDKGTIRNNLVYSDLFPGQTDYATIPTVLPSSGDVAHHPFQGEIDHFVDCILNDVESHANLEDAVNTHEVCFAAERSAAEGRPVRLPLD
jgi:predicted dehydrogenase